MNQSRTTQNKKQSGLKSASKPSATKKPATARRSSKVSQVTPPLVVGSDAEVESTDIESADTVGNAQIMSAPADLTGAAVRESDDDNDALYQGIETDDQSELSVETSSENEVAELASTAQITRM